MVKLERDKVYDVKIGTMSRPDRKVQKLLLKRDELDLLVIKPYNQGISFVMDGNVVRPEDIQSVKVFERNTFAIGKVNFVDRSGKDVTGQFIVRPPGRPILLSDSPPEMRSSLDPLFDQLITNRELREMSWRRFAAGHYADAIEASLKLLNNVVKERSGVVGKDGAELMRTVFSAKCPILRFNRLQSQSERNEQQGYMHLFEGVMIGIRNPRAHESGLNDDAQSALEILATVNHLMRKLEDTTRDSRE